MAWLARMGCSTDRPHCSRSGLWSACQWDWGLIREAGAFAPAHPWALRGAQAGIAVLISALIAITLQDRHNTVDAVDPGPALKSWVWLAVLGAIGLVLFSGSIVIFVPALAVATLSALAALFGRKGLAVGFSVAAAALFLITNLPLPGFALAALGADAAPFAALWANTHGLSSSLQSRLGKYWMYR